jgi:hypothetical protein
MMSSASMKTMIVMMVVGWLILAGVKYTSTRNDASIAA